MMMTSREQFTKDELRIIVDASVFTLSCLGHKQLDIIPLGITTEVFEFIYVGIIAFILTKRGGMTTKQKQQLR